MKNVLTAVLVSLFVLPAMAAPEDDLYALGPDSLPQTNVPKGRIIGPATLPSTVYENTSRTYWLYIPAQYDGKEPAALMVFQDGHAFVDTNRLYRIPNVLDNLIHRREMPVTIGLFINPGRTPDQRDATPEDWGDRSNNRPTEYNSLDDKYAKVICDEFLPMLYSKYNISKDPEMHGIGGASSGGICAFTVAWHRPEHFRKVVTTIGSYVNLRGGHVYPDMILEAPKKPIRIFLQDGLNDNRGTGRGGQYNPQRDWFAQNVKMVDALTKKGYDVNYIWGVGSHNSTHGGAVMPEMLRWLWRDYPRKDPTDMANRRPLVPATQPN